jgi:SAM-dependent methyltransferase
MPVAVHAENAARFDATVSIHEDFIAAVAGKMADGAFDRACELGCGTGKLLAIVAARAGKPERFVGIDLSPAQTARNATQYEGSGLEFVAADALGWVERNAAPRSLYLTYGGVLEYFTEKGVKDLFAAAARCRPACFALAEPIAPDFDLASETHSRAFGSELSFTHNYPRLLEDAGFRIEWQSEATPGFRWLKIVAVADSQ